MVQPIVDPGTPSMKAITSFKISQPVKGNRALQVRIESSNGGFSVDPHKIYVPETNTGNGFITDFAPGKDSEIGTFNMFCDEHENFVVSFTSSTETKLLGVVRPGERFVSFYGSFTLTKGDTAFKEGDAFYIPVDLDWRRVDVVNLPDVEGAVTIQIKQSQPSRYWRIVPLIFSKV